MAGGVFCCDAQRGALWSAYAEMGFPGFLSTQPHRSHRAVGGLGETHTFAKQAGGHGQLVGLEYGCPQKAVNMVDDDGDFISLARKLSFCNL